MKIFTRLLKCTLKNYVNFLRVAAFRGAASSVKIMDALP